jgi:hypothetical protein
MPLPKTTFEELYSFLLAVDEVWHKWHNAHSTLTFIGTTMFTDFSTFAGIQVTGFFRHTPPEPPLLQTVYVEASWF